MTPDAICEALREAGLALTPAEDLRWIRGALERLLATWTHVVP